MLATTVVGRLVQQYLMRQLFTGVLTCELRMLGRNSNMLDNSVSPSDFFLQSHLAGTLIMEQRSG